MSFANHDLKIYPAMTAMISAETIRMLLILFDI